MEHVSAEECVLFLTQLSKQKFAMYGDFIDPIIVCVTILKIFKNI